MTNYRELILEGKTEDLIEEVEESLQISISANQEEFQQECLKELKIIEDAFGIPLGCSSERGRPWSKGTWVAWFKNRAMELGHYDDFPKGKNIGELPGTTLHVGFLWIWETEEELERLKEHKDEKLKETIARSKISATNEIIKPIDRVAARVGP